MPRPLLQAYTGLKRKASNRLVKGMAGTFGLRVTYTGLTFIINIFLARSLGSSEFGIYIYAFTWVSLLDMIATVGLENLMVREVALYTSQKSWGLFRGLLRRADQIVFCVSFSIGLLAIAIAWNVWQATNWTMFLVFCGAMIGLPFASLRNLRRGTMDGLSQVTLGFLSETMIAPILFIILAGVAALISGSDFTASLAIIIYSAVVIISFGISTKIRHRVLPKQSKIAAPRYQMKVWLLSAIPFMMLGSLYVISNRIDILMVGALKSVEIAGIYQPVSRGAQLLTFIPAAAGRNLAAKIAKTYASGDIKQLQQIMTKSAQIIFLISCPIIIIFIGLSHWYLLLFGQEFLSGRNALIILCIGQLINLLTGLPDVLLHMTGYESHSAAIKGISVGLNVVLNAILIPHFGLEGAALATAISISFAAIVDAIAVMQKLDINPTIFSISRGAASS